MENIRVSRYEVISALSTAMDLISPVLAGHHKRTANIAKAIADELRLSPQVTDDLLIAALMHDCGSLSLADRLSTLRFDLENPGMHAVYGYKLLRTFKPFTNAARIIENHHTSWTLMKEKSSRNSLISLCSRILHLADRIDVLINKNAEILGQG